MSAVAPLKRITIEKPDFSQEQADKIQKACILRVQCKFSESQKLFEEVAADKTLSQYASIWV